MDIRFDGKKALVTGAGKGIGREVAKKLAELGANTVALSRTQSDLDSLKAEVIAKSMIERKTGGAIVNVSSAASLRGLHQHSVYCASKAAVDKLTNVMALELGQHKIRVNAVNPTVALTDLGKRAWSDPAKAEPMLARIPMGRFLEVSEIVDGIMFLLSDNATMIHGVTLPMEGGLLTS